MTDTNALKESIDNSGMSITFIAQKMGITREGFYKKMNNNTEFKASEIARLKQVLNLSNSERDRIFFAK
ncbi:toxin-antitoxin system, antitoxin component, Xre family protein [Diplocloster agilis]|uniref:toxin-antitoxin system, antitoxin component, Xre family protein n=1 Tax=Diplocloster agilis TaxID=2850323 RepID=UPI000821D220|nr:toxin-antitoxin system, antitoxin component, Xre family protein [Suonthocola fibrivorans]MCU6736461.1 toxin-antitoxin system, antitoxin component, Xre family protein [Suonthocola fibrivorans]SCJ90776.1 Uncharacterised protein [uncultured Clostridium sp.]